MGLEVTSAATCVAAATPCDTAVTTLYMTPAREPKATFGLTHTVTEINSTATSIRLCGVPTKELRVLFEYLRCS